MGRGEVLYLRRNLWSPYLPEAGSEIQAIAVKYFSLMEFFSINFIRMDQSGPGDAGLIPRATESNSKVMVEDRGFYVWIQEILESASRERERERR